MSICLLVPQPENLQPLERVVVERYLALLETRKELTALQVVGPYSFQIRGRKEIHAHTTFAAHLAQSGLGLIHLLAAPTAFPAWVVQAMEENELPLAVDIRGPLPEGVTLRRPFRAVLPLDPKKVVSSSALSHALSLPGEQLTSVELVPLINLLPVAKKIEEVGLFTNPSAIIPGYSFSLRENSPVFSFFEPKSIVRPGVDEVAIATFGKEAGLLKPMITDPLESFLERLGFLDIAQVVVSPQQPDLLLWVALARSLGALVALSDASRLLDTLDIPYLLLSIDTISRLKDWKALARTTRASCSAQVSDTVNSLYEFEEAPTPLVEKPSSPTESEAATPGEKPSVSFCIQLFYRDSEGLAKTIQSIRTLGVPDYEIIIAGAPSLAQGEDITELQFPSAAAERRYGVLRDHLLAESSKDICVFCTSDVDFEPEFYYSLCALENPAPLIAPRVLNLDGTRYWDWLFLTEDDQMLLDYEDSHEELCISFLVFILTGEGKSCISFSDDQLLSHDVGMKALVQQFFRRGLSVELEPTLAVRHRTEGITQQGRKVITDGEKSEGMIEILPGIEAYGLAPDPSPGIFNLTGQMQLYVLEENLHYPSKLTITIQQRNSLKLAEEQKLLFALPTGQVIPLTLTAAQPSQTLSFSIPASYYTMGFSLDVASGSLQRHDYDGLAIGSINIEYVSKPPGITGLNWRSHLFDFSGYASLARTLLPLLVQKGVPTDLASFPGEKKFYEQLHQDPDIAAFWNQLAQRRVESGIGLIYYVPATPDDEGCFTKYKEKRPYLDYFIGFTMLEVDRIPPSWVEECNAMDEVWVPSEFCAEVFAASGVEKEKLQTIPIGIDSTRFSPEITPLIPKDEHYRFLSIFQWNNRKGWNFLLDAYLEEFTREDNVELLIRAYPDRFKKPSIKERIHEELKKRGFTFQTAPKISLLEDFIPDSQMPALYTSVDCFVLPSRGEGIGLPYMEAMASGLPVIATAWGGQMDFLTEDNSLLVEIEGYEEVDLHHRLENPHYRRGMKWALPSVRHLRELLRTIFVDREMGQKIGALACATMRKEWHLEKTAAWMTERINTISVAQGLNLGSTREAPDEPTLLEEKRV